MSGWRRTAMVGGILVALAGCAPGGGATQPSSSTASATATSTATSTAGELTPVIDEDFPDPDVVKTADGWQAFATGVPGLNIRVAASPDLRTWTVERRDALPTLPLWASSGRTWAPDVSQRSDGTWVMYFAAQDATTGRQCIGVATSSTVDGTFAPASDKPLVCPLADGGAIDPSMFKDDDGARYLLWKTDGNCCGLDTWIEVARLSEDGLALVDAPTRLIKQNLAWEGDVVEAPVLVRHGDDYVLFYSANAYSGDSYAVGAAHATSLLGPYTKQPEPVLSTAGSDGRLRGPGGQDVVVTGNGEVLFFHAWDPLYTYRALYRLALRWRADGSVAVAG